MSQGSVEPRARGSRPIDPGVSIGHVHLRTADIDRARWFYVDVLGFDVVNESRGVPGWGTAGDTLFVSAGGYHHHLAFNTWKSAGGGPQPDGVAGLHHVAIRYPTRAALADALRRLREIDWPIRQATDHGKRASVDPGRRAARAVSPSPPAPLTRTRVCGGGACAPGYLRMRAHGRGECASVEALRAGNAGPAALLQVV